MFPIAYMPRCSCHSFIVDRDGARRPAGGGIWGQIMVSSVVRAWALLHAPSPMRAPREAVASSLRHAAVCDPLPTPQAEAAFVRAVQKVLWTARGGPGHAALVRAMATWFVSKQRFSEVPFSSPLRLTAGRDLFFAPGAARRVDGGDGGVRPAQAARPPRRPACPCSARPCVAARVAAERRAASCTSPASAPGCVWRGAF